MSDDVVREPAPGRRLVESGEVVAGSMTRAAAGLLFGSPGTAVRLDGALAWCLRSAATAAAAVPVRREQIRAGAAVAFAVELSATRAHEGRGVRTDGYLAPEGGDRAPADEIVEAVLLAARQTPEEWRVRHLGYLLAEAAVSPDLDAAVVHLALRLAGELTGRQLVLLAGIGRRDRIPLPMAALPEEPRGWSAWGALEDLTDLQRRGLVDPPPAQPRPGGAARPRLRMPDLRLTRRGVLLHRLLVLDFLRDDAVTAVLADLGLPRS